MEQLGINKKPHECRHSFATKINDAGVPELIRKRLLGHSTQDITDRYTHTSIIQLTQEIDKL